MKSKLIQTAARVRNLKKHRRLAGLKVAAASVIASMGATTAFATTYSTNNSKISEVQTSSVFVGTTRLSVEGDSLGSFAGFGVIDFNSNSLSVPDYTTVNGINGTTMTLNLVDRSPLDNFAKEGQVDFFLATGSNGNSSLTNYRFQGFASNGGAGTQLGSLTSLGSFNYTAGIASGRNDTVTLDFSSGGAGVLSYLNSQLSTGGNVRIIAAPHSATVAANWQGSLTSTNTSPILNSPSLSFDLNTTAAPATDATFVLNPGAAKTLSTGPIIINRILASSSTNVTVAIQNTGTGSGSFKFNSIGSVTGSGGTNPLSGGGTTNVTLNFAGSGFTAGSVSTLNPGTASIAIHNRSNPGDTTDAIVNFQVNSVVTARFIDNVGGNAGYDFGRQLVGSTNVTNIALDTENTGVANLGSNTLSIVTLKGTTSVTGTNANISTRGILSVATGTADVSFSSGSESTTRDVSLTPLVGGDYAVNHLTLGFVNLPVSYGPGETAIGATGTPTAGRIVATGTFYEKALVTASGSTVGTLSLANAIATVNTGGVSGSSAANIGLRADAQITATPTLIAQNGYSLTGLDNGTVIAAGSNVTGTAAFDTTGKLNGRYFGTVSVGMQHADQTIIGTALNDLPTKTFNLATTVTGNSGNGSANILPGQSYGSIASPYFINRGSGSNTTVSFLGGTASANTTLAVAFGTSASTRANGDKAAITGNGTDKYVVQFSYNPASTNNATALGYYDGSKYVNPVFGNTGGASSTNSAEVNGAFNNDFTLGNYGIDTTNHVAWAVVNHPGTFAPYRRAAGDTNFRGSVSFTDISQIISRGRYGITTPSPTLTHWSDGDFNGDNKVDFSDINAIISAGTFGTGNYDGASPSVASVHTAKLTSANPAVTTTGTAGDGVPDFSYDALTGDVKFFRDGYDSSKKVRSVVLLSAGNNFITGVGYTFQGNDSFDVDEAGQQAVGRFNGNGITVNPLDLGAILPIGLSASQLQSDLSLYFNYDGSGAADPNGVPVGLIGGVVPEPTTLSLLGLGAVGLLARRRRKA